MRLLGPARLTLPAGPAAEVVADLLGGEPVFGRAGRGLLTAAWRKLLQNAAAGLMALTTRRSGVFRRPDVQILALRYLREGLRVARADGAELRDDVPDQSCRFPNGPANHGTSILSTAKLVSRSSGTSENGVMQRRGRALGVPHAH